VLGAQGTEDDGQDAGDGDRQEDERDETQRGLIQRPTAHPEEREKNRRDHDAGRVLERAPAEQRVLRGAVGRPPAALRDVDDDDR
jgi:hypothetical protein